MNPLISLLLGKNPNDVYNELLKTNPQFKQFVEKNAGKSPEQIMNDYNVDPSLMSYIFKKGE